MSPSSGLQVGTVLNLTCSLVYGGPSTDYDKVRALSSTQDPQISITVGSFTYNQSWHGPLVYQDYVTADNVTSVRSLVRFPDKFFMKSWILFSAMLCLVASG